MFTMEIIDPSSSRSSQVLDSCEIRMEDLLQAKFENRTTLDLFDQVAKVRVNTLIFLINRSEYLCCAWLVMTITDVVVCLINRILRIEYGG